ncbi:hypothetical protein JOC83_003167 [Bacillus iocasae]|uniref:Uncharacterized protein n=1 Tax=Priestia iocasae TaxID=2291674 RepID=A0ABS2QY19_9BACI|nr:hypothetical protein [Metabacillus iocasae]
MGKLIRRILVAVFPILMKEGYNYYKNRKRNPNGSKSYK